MARQRWEVIWTLQAQATLDAAISYIAEYSVAAAQQMLERALKAAASLALLANAEGLYPNWRLLQFGRFS